MKDEDIDLSDIPEITEEQMAQAVLRVNGNPVEKGKQRVNIFLDTFVLEYFKAKAGSENVSDENRGYQGLINAALGEYIKNHDLKEDLRHIFREELSRSAQDSAQSR